MVCNQRTLELIVGLIFEYFLRKRVVQPFDSCVKTSKLINLIGSDLMNYIFCLNLFDLRIEVVILSPNLVFELPEGCCMF